MPVGALETAVTVTGESPTVDVKSARREQVVNRELLTAIPSARTYQTLVALAPGVTTTGTQDVGGLNSPATRAFGIHGGPATEGRVMVDGMPTGGARGGAGVSNYNVDVASAQEVTYTLSGGLGEAETGGPIGYGRAFRLAQHRGARGASEYQDVVAGAKYLRSRDDVDSKRIGLWGGSYGGYLTALGLARRNPTSAA